MQFGMCKQSLEHEYHTAVPALGSSQRTRTGEQELRSRTSVAGVAPLINNGAGCNENRLVAGSREKFFLDSPLS